jgi:hypothetical protein
VKLGTLFSFEIYEQKFAVEDQVWAPRQNERISIPDIMKTCHPFHTEVWGAHYGRPVRTVDFKVSCSEIPHRGFAGIQTLTLRLRV